MPGHGRYQRPADDQRDLPTVDQGFRGLVPADRVDAVVAENSGAINLMRVTLSCDDPPRDGASYICIEFAPFCADWEQPELMSLALQFSHDVLAMVNSHVDGRVQQSVGEAMGCLRDANRRMRGDRDV